MLSSRAQEPTAPSLVSAQAPTPSNASAQASVPMYIREYRVLDAHQLKPIEVQEAVYPFLGPGRTAEDVEHARAALEQAYKDKGFQSVAVQVPVQSGRRGIIVMQVVENRIGRLRVRGSRYFSPEQIKKGAPSLAEGKVPNFDDITKDILNLNQLPDRRVTPSMPPGVEPGTVDIDLTVKDTLPLHGSVELNNRYIANTTELRLNGAISYNNLWQLGHSAGMSFQIAPENPDETKVFTGYYTVRFPSLPKLSFTLQGTKQDSDVSTLGTGDVLGRGEVIGMRLNVTLPAGNNFYQFFSFGVDYKHLTQDTFHLTATQIEQFSAFDSAPVTYFPITATYGANWIEKGYSTEFNTDLVLNFRGMGSDAVRYDYRRYNSDGNFIYLRGDLSHTHDLPVGFQAYGKVQGQISSGPLLDSEQYAGGGLDTARGYLEATALGDNGLFGTFELRSPSLFFGYGGDQNEWRIYAFCDAGLLTVHSPLPEQTDRFNLVSVGFGSRIKLIDHFNGSLDVGFPLTQPDPTLSSTDPLLTFRVWAEF